MAKKASHESFLVAAALLALLCCGFAGAQMDSAHSGPVMNYHRVNERLVTGGHLLDGGTAALKEQGVQVVIDLRDNSPSGEQERYAEQGIEWINIPVEWRDPKEADFDHFSEVMREHQDDHVLVQCAANYRASAMTYLYRVVVEKVPEDKAAEDLHAVWDPDDNDTWRDYVNEIKADPSSLPFDSQDGCKEGPLAQFGQYLGDWRIEDSTLSQETGEWEPGKGARWLFTCLGDGAAVQDFWMPSGGTVGTNLRTYNTDTESWDIAWAIKGAPGFAHIVAEQNASGEIVMRYKSPPQDPPRKITFFPVDDDGWNWKLEFSFDGGDNWTEVYRIKATRNVQ